MPKTQKLSLVIPCYKAAAGWLSVLKRLYAIFRLPPFDAPHIRVLKKSQKHYHKDYLTQDGIRVQPA